LFSGVSFLFTYLVGKDIIGYQLRKEENVILRL
jgi:hypothetical protein